MEKRISVHTYVKHIRIKMEEIRREANLRYGFNVRPSDVEEKYKLYKELKDKVKLFDACLN